MLINRKYHFRIMVCMNRLKILFCIFVNMSVEVKFGKTHKKYEPVRRHRGRRRQ